MTCVLACYVGLPLCIMFSNLLCMIPKYAYLCGELFYFAHLHLDLLIAALPLCISSYRFELWVPIERHWLGMQIMIWSSNGALPLYNTIIAMNLAKRSFLCY